MTWALYLRTNKGWVEESSHDNKQEAEYVLHEWKEEFPNCYFIIKEKGQDNE